MCKKFALNFKFKDPHLHTPHGKHALWHDHAFKLVRFRTNKIEIREWKHMLVIRGSLQKIWRKNIKQWTHCFVMIPPVKILLSRHLNKTQRSWHQIWTNKIFTKHPNNKFLMHIHGVIKTIFNNLLLLFRLCYINLQYKIQITSWSPSTLLQLFQTCHCIQHSIQDLHNSNNSSIWIVNKTTTICFIIKQIPTFQTTTISWNNWLAKCASSLATKMNKYLSCFGESNI